MNILAHLYLSGSIGDVMLGNFMGDFVKGRQYQNYPSQIQQGILLHRKIDDITDNHPVHKQSRDRFRTKYGLHSGVVVDIVYDHFLASHWENYQSMFIEEYAARVYQYIEENLHWLPPRLKEITPIIIENNWLVMYKSHSGLERVLTGMSRRTSLPNHVPFAMTIVEKEYLTLFTEFEIVMKSLIETTGFPWTDEKNNLLG